MDYNRLNIKAYEILTTGYRKLHCIQKSIQSADTLLEIDP